MTAEPVDLPEDTGPVSLPKRAPAPPAPMATRRAPAAGQCPVESTPDGTRVEYRQDGTPSRQWNPDGSLVTFDDAGRAAVETLPDGSTITFHPNGTSTERQLDGTTFELDAAGQPVVESTPQGTRYTGFDPRGRPTQGVLPDGRHFSLSYDAEGHTIERFTDGHLVEAGPNGKVIREVTPKGTTFTRFDATGRPTAGTTAAGKRFSVTYDARGTAVETFADGSVARVPAPPPHPAVRQVATDGSRFTASDGGRPTAGLTAPGMPFMTTGDPHGGAVERLGGGGAERADPGGRTAQQVAPDGTRYTAFDGGGRPTGGVTAAGVPFTMTYDPSGGVTESLATGETVQADPQGRTVRQVTPDGTTFTDFDASGRPTSGTTAAGEHFTMSYDTHGDTFVQTGDGTVVETDAQGHVVQTWTTHGPANDWRVDLGALNSAIGQVSAERDAISGSFAQLKASFANIENLWQSPAGMSFHPLADTFTQVSESLIDLLDQAVERMQSSYRNYANTEDTNTANLR